MNTNTKLIFEIAVGISGIIGLGVLCKKTCRTNNVESNATSESIRDVSDKSDCFINENSAQIEADFVNTINTIRLKKLFSRLQEIDYRDKDAQKEINQLKSEIHKILSSNRGGKTGMHGFIGESCQVHIANVKSFLQGRKALYVLLDDNSMTDYKRGSLLIQQKACQSDNHLGLDHVKHHANKYPEFLNNGGRYQIPRDFYQKYIFMRNTPPEIANKFRKEDLRLWNIVHEFESENPEIILEPMEVSYREIQSGNITNTISEVERAKDAEIKKQKNEAMNHYSPSAKEFFKVASISGMFEGAINATLTTAILLKEGKKLNDFDRNDRIYILKQFALGFLRGSLRSGITYLLTALYKIPTTLASTVTTILFMIAKHTQSFLKKSESKADYIMGLFIDLIEISLTTLGACIGKSIIKKHPLIGSLLGSIIFSTGCRYAQKYAYA